MPVVELNGVIVLGGHREPDDLAREQSRGLGGVLVVVDKVVEWRQHELGDRGRRALADDPTARSGVRLPDHPLAGAVVVQDVPAAGCLGDRHPPLRLAVVQSTCSGVHSSQLILGSWP